MQKRIVLGFLLALLSVGVVITAFHVKPVLAIGTVHIRADGSIDPAWAPISTIDKITYFFTGNMYSETDGVVIERSNIVVDGNGYTLQSKGPTYGTGFSWRGINNVTLRNTIIKDVGYAIDLRYGCNYSTISGNSIMNVGTGIHLYSSSNQNIHNIISGNSITNVSGWGITLNANCSYNTISGNDVTNSSCGIKIHASSDNVIFGNNIANTQGDGINISHSSSNTISGNNVTASKNIGIAVMSPSSSNNRLFHNTLNNKHQAYLGDTSYSNVWDDGYPSGGNYWSDYVGPDLKSGPGQNQFGSDGIGDCSFEPMFFNMWKTNVTDHYPLMAPIRSFNAGSWSHTPYHVEVVGNSTITDLTFNATGKTITFAMEGESGTTGFCRVAVPKSLLWCSNPNDWTVIVDGTIISNFNVTDSENYAYICFSYTHSTHEVTIIGTSAVQESTRTPVSTSLSLNAPPATQGQSVTLKATLRDESGHPIQGMTIQFQMSNGANWMNISLATTDSNGIASINYTPSSTDSYLVRAVFAGAADYASSQSMSANLSASTGAGTDFALYYVGGGIIAVVAIGAIAYMTFRRLRRKTAPQKQAK